LKTEKGPSQLILLESDWLDRENVIRYDRRNGQIGSGWLKRGLDMRINLTSIFVRDQQKALEFYTEVLGFAKKTDLPVGQYRWLTIVSQDDPDGVELLLEPNAHPAARAYQEAIFADGIPSASFAVDDIRIETQRLKKLGVVFQTEPTDIGPATIAIFDDTCGNLIQMAQVS